MIEDQAEALGTFRVCRRNLSEEATLMCLVSFLLRIWTFQNELGMTN